MNLKPRHFKFIDIKSKSKFKFKVPKHNLKVYQVPHHLKLNIDLAPCIHC